MIVDVQVQVSHGKVKIHVPQANLQVDMPDIVACETRTRQIVAIGQTADQVQLEAPQQWQRHADRIEFRPAFDAARFEPEFALAVLNYYAEKARARIRPGLIVRFIGSYIDKFHYDLRLPGYEDLPAKTRTKFVRLLRSLPCIRRCSINGKRVLDR